ncbi:hypothetical protein AAG570_004795 [Ranatra chinensis]|uniref:PH domain-containing protein n=1 Tax=Ranatra chinensis TaxID=642074 RepID=A0ABD0YQD5_9HEMI
MQGCLRRKTILKDGRKPAVASWQRYWVQLWANSLVFYLPKAFKGTERTDYRREPCKVTPTTGCLVSLSDNPMHPDIFHIRDPIKSNLYKFKACSREEAQSWFSALQETLGLGQDADNPANLISFE